MHFEVLAEDQSGRLVIEGVLPKILGTNGATHSWRTHAYRGLGRIPRDLRGAVDPRKRMLLDRLPALLRGYGRQHRDLAAAVIVVVDQDRRDCHQFKDELLAVLEGCRPHPRTLFRIAIEEIEAWLLGDREAVETAYPRAKRMVLDRYVQDSVCGTWEVLADAVAPGGAKRIKSVGWPETGRVKCEWAQTIAPYMDPDRNRSTSFRVFRDGLRALARQG